MVPVPKRFDRGRISPYSNTVVPGAVLKRRAAAGFGAARIVPVGAATSKGCRVVGVGVDGKSGAAKGSVRWGIEWRRLGKAFAPVLFGER